MSKIFQDQSEMNVIFVHSMLDEFGLSVYAFRVYCHIARRANRAGSAFPGMQSIARVCAMSETTVKKAVKELEDRKVLDVRRTVGGSSSNIYYLNPPSKWLHQPGRDMTGSPHDPVATRPGPGRQAPPKVIQEGNPSSPIAPKGAEADESGDIKNLKAKIKEAVNPWFNRRPTTKWSEKEERALRKVCDVFEDEDLDLLDWYFTKSGCEYLRKDIITLLNNWRGECDRAMNYNGK